MNDNRVQHLHFIGRTIDRLARNSFHLKALAIVLVSAVLAAGAAGADWRYYLVGLFPALALWGLDANRVRQMRMFRGLYERIRAADDATGGPDAYSLDVRPHMADAGGWLSNCVSMRVAGFYLPLTLIVAAASIVAWIVTTAE